MPEKKTTSANAEITNAITQADTLTLGVAPSFSNAATSIAMAESISHLMLDAVQTHQNASITSSSAATMGSIRLLQAGLISNADSNATKPIIDPSVAQDISNHVDRLANQAISLMDKTSEHYEPAKNALSDLVSRLTKSAVKEPEKATNPKASSKK